MNASVCSLIRATEKNKNSHVLSMLFFLRNQRYPQLTIDYHFPIRGYSFFPADRAFGRIEQDIRKRQTILLPAEYFDILKRHGNVHEYGKDWVCYDFKTEAATFTKTQRSFKISDARVLQVAGDNLGFKAAYGGDFCHHLKRGKRWSQFKPAASSDVNCVKLAKKQDVVKFLDELGVNKNVQKYYQGALSDANDTYVGSWHTGYWGKRGL